MAQKWVKNGPKMTHFWPKNGPKMGPILDPKSLATFDQMAQKGVQKWAQKWPKNGSKMAHFWPIFGPLF